MTDLKYEPGDQVRILVGGPHDNLLKEATVNRVQEDGDVVVYLGDRDEDEWVYSPHEIEPLRPLREDPKFPDRPQHSDFWTLSEAVQELDSKSDDGPALAGLVAGGVDVQSLLYMAVMRARLAVRELPAFEDFDPQDLASVWVDGFMAGARFLEMRQEKAVAASPDGNRRARRGKK
jgi:hypothetical protein